MCLHVAPPECVYGALLGTQKGRGIEICNSFELVVTLIEGQVVLDRDYFTEKEEQCKTIFIPFPLSFSNSVQFTKCFLPWSFWVGIH